MNEYAKQLPFVIYAERVISLKLLQTEESGNTISDTLSIENIPRCHSNGLSMDCRCYNYHSDSYIQDGVV